MTLAPIADHLAVELFLRIRSVSAWIRNPTFRLRGQRSKPLRHRRDGHCVLIIKEQMFASMALAYYRYGVRHCLIKH